MATEFRNNLRVTKFCQNCSTRREGKSKTYSFQCNQHDLPGMRKQTANMEIIAQGYLLTYLLQDGFGGLVVSMLASGTQVCGFKPGRSRWIFTVVKVLSMPSSGGEVKESVPCPSFAACKRT